MTVGSSKFSWISTSTVGVDVGLFGRNSRKEIDLALNHLNGVLISHYQDWDKILKLSLGAEACSQQPIEKVAPAFRTMWVECHRRALVMLFDARKNYELVAIKTPEILQVLNIEEFEQVTKDQMKRMGELMGSLMRKTCDLNPSHEEELSKLLDEPEMGEIKEEAKRKVGL